MYSMAMIFCGELIGDAIPPTLDAKAMPRIKHFANDELGGSVRRIGYTVFEITR
jgi:hypothetical protein